MELDEHYYDEDYENYLEGQKEINNKPMTHREFVMLDVEKHGLE